MTKSIKQRLKKGLVCLVTAAGCSGQIERQPEALTEWATTVQACIDNVGTEAMGLPAYEIVPARTRRTRETVQESSTTYLIAQAENPRTDWFGRPLQLETYAGSFNRYIVYQPDTVGTGLRIDDIVATWQADSVALTQAQDTAQTMGPPPTLGWLLNHRPVDTTFFPISEKQSEKLYAVGPDCKAERAIPSLDRQDIPYALVNYRDAAGRIRATVDVIKK